MVHVEILKFIVSSSITITLIHFNLMLSSKAYFKGINFMVTVREIVNYKFCIKSQDLFLGSHLYNIRPSNNIPYK